MWKINRLFVLQEKGGMTLKEKEMQTLGEAKELLVWESFWEV